MGVFLGGFLLFFFLFFLILSFYFYYWNGLSSYDSGFRSWVSSFECGFLSYGLFDKYFSFTYFVLLVFFVVFDLEISLLLNLPFQGLMYKKMFSYLFFLLLLVLGFGVEINKGYVCWSY